MSSAARPPICECGGRMDYAVTGSYVCAYCRNCTPVLAVTLPAPTQAMPPVRTKHPQAAEVTTDCRSDTGVTVGLIDSIITAGHALAGRALDAAPVVQALADLRADRDVRRLIQPSPALAGAQATGDEPDYMRIYRKHWKSLVETDGKLDIDKVARELSDYHGVLGEVPKVYAHVTGGLLSKPNYHARGVISAADDHLNSVVDDAVKDAHEEWEADQSSRLSDDDRRAAFMAGWHNAVDQTDKCGETHWTPAEAYAAWLAQRPKAQPLAALDHAQESR